MDRGMIPVYRTTLAGNERRYVNECLETTWISSKGRFIDLFERSFAAYTGAAHAVAVCNGTVALHLALVALGIGPGDEVIVPSLTYVASANAVAYTGATPVFADSRRDTWQIDPEDVARRITPRTRAIMAVHLYGHPCDMDALAEVAARHGVVIVEDCAEAFGTLYRGRHVGTFGEVGTFSFYGNKTITCGEGGMITTSRGDIRERLAHLRNQGADPRRRYWHDAIGYNYRMTNIAAAIGLAQLERADAIIEAKRQLARWYDEALSGMAVGTQREVGDVRHTWWMYSVLLPDGIDRDAVMGRLEARGVETRPLFYPVHTLPMYARGGARLPVAEDLARRGMNLPSWPGLTEEQVRFIVRELQEALRHCGC